MTSCTDCKPWAYELTHTKAVRGMVKTANRRKRGRQHIWMLCRPTLDALWFAPIRRRIELRMSSPFTSERVNV